MRLRRSHFTFGQIADKWAREVSNQPDALSRDEILHEMIRAVWRGDFEDEDEENSCLTIHRSPPGGEVRGGVWTEEARPEPFNRIKLLGALTLDSPVPIPLPPPRRFRTDDAPWQSLFELTRAESNQTMRERYLEALTITKEDFGRWCDERGHQRPTFWFGTSESGKKKVASGAPSTPARRRRPGRRHGPYYLPLQKALRQLATQYSLHDVELWEWKDLRRAVELTGEVKADDLPKDTQFKTVCRQWFAAAHKSGKYTH